MKFTKIEGEPSFLEMAYEYFEEAAALTTIRPDLLEVLKEANAVLKVNIPLVRDNGSIEFIPAFRS
jgi:glutamate dehydrogenase/leucine dehydrogenase